MKKLEPRKPPDVSPLARLRQIALDLDRAIGGGNWAVVIQAAALLAPVLEECRRGSVSSQEAMQVQAQLDVCVQKLTAAMSQTGEELRRLRQGKRRLTTLAAVPQRTASRQLDTHR